MYGILYSIVADISKEINMYYQNSVFLRLWLEIIGVETVEL